MTATLDARACPLATLAGPSGSGRTRALAERIAAVLGTDPNPSTLLVVTATPAEAAALRARLVALCGVRRTHRCSILSLDALAERLSRCAPRIALASPTTRAAIAESAYVHAGLSPEGGAALTCLEASRRAGVTHDPVVTVYTDTLTHLGRLDPTMLFDRGAREWPTLEHLFVDDVDRMPRSVERWLERQAATGTSVTLTRLAAADCAGRAMDVRRVDYSSPSAEVQAMLAALALDSPPDAFVLSSWQVEARLVFRAALDGIPLVSAVPYGARHSREWRFLATALDAALTDSPAALRTLLALHDPGGHETRALLRDGMGRERNLADVLEARTWRDASPAFAEALEALSLAWRAWRDTDFPVDRLHRIAEWLASTGRFTRPELWSIVAAEMPFDVPLAAVLEALTHAPVVGPHARIFAVEDVTRGCVDGAWVSVTRRDPSGAASFLAGASRAARRRLWVSRSPLDEPDGLEFA
jgi:hypothetical protein